VQRPGVRLDPEMGEAIRKLTLIDTMTRSLPGRDCGACGAPTCAAFAEDTVMGRAAEGCPHRGVTRMEDTQ
jgi:Na+-translocating ferredoxin:NAD+ oxidoreductase RNF subunit RnfB